MLTWFKNNAIYQAYSTANAHVNNKEVEFFFKNGTQLEIFEKGGIIQINSLEIIECNNCS